MTGAGPVTPEALAEQAGLAGQVRGDPRENLRLPCRFNG
jgi:hypothetical protein